MFMLSGAVSTIGVLCRGQKCRLSSHFRCFRLVLVARGCFDNHNEIRCSFAFRVICLTMKPILDRADVAVSGPPVVLQHLLFHCRGSLSAGNEKC